MKLLTLCALAALLFTPAFARIGETEPQLLKRFGRPMNSESRQVSLHGLTFEVGRSLTFILGEWTITCDLIDGQCVRIDYSKIGPWAEENFQTVLNANAQGEKWSDLLSPSVKQLTRRWRRDDGITAQWVVGSLTVTSPLYERGKALAEEKAKAAAQLADGIAAF